MEKKRPGNLQGKRAEDYAAKLLVDSGYIIIDKNFRSKFGEIDIIAKKDGVLVFVEVKARWSPKFGAPEDAVTSQKLYKIRKTADYYCLINSIVDQKMRIDVVAIEIESGHVASAKIINVD